MSTKGSMSKQVWLVAIVFTVVGYLIGLAVGGRLIPINLHSSKTETVQNADVENKDYIGTWKNMSKTDSYILTINEDGTAVYDRYWYEDLSERRTGVLRGNSLTLTKSTQYTNSVREDGTTEVVTSVNEATLVFNVSLSEDGVLILSRENGFSSTYLRDTEYQ